MFRIKYDQQQVVYLTLLTDKQDDNLKGLCGSYNKNPEGKTFCFIDCVRLKCFRQYLVNGQFVDCYYVRFVT